jgi:secreted trypsin-like serine protease
MFFWIIILFTSVKSSSQTNYNCNPNVSCGCSINSTTITRIVNGETAEIGAWGWTVSLEIEQRFLCGGSVISPSWVITAAHCMKDVIASDINVYAGSNDLWSGNQIRNGLRVIVHPNYDPNTLSNDIALIKLSSPLDVTNSSIRTICLPSINSTILSYSEWPVANTTVNISFSFFDS